jgi:hypothetical protein
MKRPNTTSAAILALPDGVTFTVSHRSMAYANEIQSRCPEFKASREDKFEGEVTDGAGNLLGGPWTFLSVEQALAWAKNPANSAQLRDGEVTA